MVFNLLSVTACFHWYEAKQPILYHFMLSRCFNVYFPRIVSRWYCTSKFSNFYLRSHLFNTSSVDRRVSIIYNSMMVLNAFSGTEPRQLNFSLISAVYGTKSQIYGSIFKEVQCFSILHFVTISSFQLLQTIFMLKNRYFLQTEW